MVGFLIMYYKVLGSSLDEAMMFMYSWHYVIFDEYDPRCSVFNSIKSKIHNGFA